MVSFSGLNLFGKAESTVAKSSGSTLTNLGSTLLGGISFLGKNAISMTTTILSIGGAFLVFLLTQLNK